LKTVKVQGGIGNQLFCLAFAHSVSRLSREPTALDLAAFDADRYGHAFVLEDLARDLGEVRLTRRPLFAARPTTALMRMAPVPGYASEGAPPADAAALAALVARGRYFNGYWQNEAYIAQPEDFADMARKAVLRRAGPPRGADLVIHYRSYREEIRPRARRTAGPDYVRAALAHIEAALGRPGAISLVSDDPAAAAAALAGLGREISFASGGGAWDDLGLLMRARALILTNSSFSWWGGFCGAAQVAVYPRPDGYFHYPVPAARFTVL
jgi:hypothetical protein